MPTKRKGKGKPHRKQMKSRQRAGKQLIVSRLPTVGGVPDEIDVTLRYVEIINLSSTLAQAGYVFRGNDTFDPNQTGTGLQPAYRDAWAALYKIQQVMSSSIMLRITPDVNTGSVPGILMAAPSQTSTLNDVDYVRSLPQSQSRALNFYTPPRPIRITSSLAHMKGVQVVRNQGVGSSLVGATPADQWFWLIIMRSADGAGPTTTDVEVTIDYRVRFSERVPANLSVLHAQRNKEAFEAAQAKKPKSPVYVELPVKTRERARPIAETKGEDSLESKNAFLQETKAVLDQPSTQYASTNCTVARHSDEYVLVPRTDRNGPAGKILYSAGAGLGLLGKS